MHKKCFGNAEIAAIQTERKQNTFAEYKNNYGKHLDNVRCMLKNDGNGIGVLAPAMYVLKLGKTKIAIDPSLWELPANEDDLKQLVEILSECDVAVTTHGHSDHYDAGLIEMLSEKTLCFVPDFISQKGKNIIKTEDGYISDVGDVKLTFFESAHSADGNIVPEYGFAVTYAGENYLFPADVRDYEKQHMIFPDTKVVVAHLWLGRENALNIHNNLYVERFCNFVNSFGSERVFLSHLFDWRRTIEDMWTDIHFDLVKNHIENCSFLKLGDRKEL